MDELDTSLKSVNLSKPQSPIKQILALATLGACLLLGGLGTFLFNNSFHASYKFWGLNIAIFGLALAISLLILRRLGQRPLSFTGYVLIISGLFFTITLAWRDSLVLNALSLLGILLTINLAFGLGTRRKLQPIYVSETLFDLSWSIKYGINSYHHLINQDIKWHEVQKRWGGVGHAIFRGLVITIPLFVVFALLFIASDARFENMVNSLLNWGWEPNTIYQNILIFILSSWIVAAILRGAVLKQGLTPNQNYPRLPTWSLGTVEIVMLLGTLNILFLVFIAVQFSYFFGGDALVQSLYGPTYSNYARRGFFQLVIVAILAITLLLMIHWAHKPLRRLGKKLFLWLAVIMVILTMIIEASAAHRMYLYTNVYGLTELRFYTSVFMGWVIVLFGWFSVTVLRGQRAYFSFGAVLTGMIFIGSLHFVNPDAQIAAVNLERLQDGQRFDHVYLASLSADAIPTLYAALDDIPKSKNRCENLWRELKSHRVLQPDDNWPYLNLSRYKAPIFNWRYLNLSRYKARKLLAASESKCR